jgi:ArsR family transcriptional regulator, lead/cadmium/zinc/bismuth-responsive transcriptional repressor
VVASRSHEHPVNSEGVAAARDGVLSVADAGRLAGLLGMLADPVRSRILFALVTAGELCVGDLALALDVTEDQVSYGLKMLRLAGLVSFRRDGRMVCYRLSDGFPHPLLEHCLRQLLTIAAPPQPDADPQASPAAHADPAAHASPAHRVGPAPKASQAPEADPACEASQTQETGRARP